MRWVFAIIVGAWLAVADSATADAIRYTLSPAVENGALKAIAIEMVFAGEPDGETEIDLPGEWGGKQDLWRGISEFRVSGEGLGAVAGIEPTRKIIRHAPNAVLTVRYRLTQFWAGEPTASGQNEYRPIVRRNYFHFIGHTAFARPNWSLATPVSVALRNLPAGWHFASDLEHRVAGRPLRLADILESVSVGGDFRVVKTGQLRVAIRGTWPFSDEDFVKRLQPIIASHHKFWGDPETPFLVTVLPLLTTPGQSSLGGTALGDSFAFFASANVESGDLTRILAHEHLHSWIPRQVGTMPEQNDTADYWLSEGFADFYSYRLLLRDGMWTTGDAAAAFNKVLWTYAFSRVRTASNARVVRDFWSDAEVNQLPYQRGFLLAALWDYRVRQATTGAKDLDDVMLGMKQDASAVSDQLPPPARQLFIANMQKFGVDVSDDVARFVEKGEAIVLPADVWAPCGPVSTGEIAEFDRGFDGRRTIANANFVRGVDPAGPAFAAGLRDDMRIMMLDLGQGGDARVELVYRTMADGKERTIHYLPEGKRHFTVQEFKITPAADEAGQKACAARLAGTG